MRNIDEIIIHCAATRPSQDIGAKEIRRWHVHGNGWDDIGYHFVIRRDGTIERGRALDIPGAHTGGRNEHSIGICLVGGVHETHVVYSKSGNRWPKPEDNFTPEQFDALESVLDDLIDAFGDVEINPHKKYAKKACPSFDLAAYLVERGFRD